MAQPSSIEWTDATWNPVRGCTSVSPGCGGPGPHGGCYAEAIAARFSKPGQAYHGLAEMRGGKPRWTGKLAFGFDLDTPLRWRKPRRIFVNSMSDLFLFTREEVATVYAVAVAAHHLRGHTFQILTKRSAGMRAMLRDPEFWDQVNAEASAHVLDGTDPLGRRSDDARATLGDYGPDAPPPGIWLGVSAEDQQRVDERVPDLLATPAAVRFVSAEPLLGPISLEEAWYGETALDAECWGDCGWCEKGYPPLHNCQRGRGDWERGRSGLDWIIVGGESGPGARPMHPDWARSLRDQCAAADVPFHFKQWGEWKPISEMPEPEHAALYVSRRQARQGENQDTVDEFVGRRCTVPVEMLGYDGARGHDAFIQVEGRGGMAFFRVGKAAAGRLLDGVEHNSMPRAACASPTTSAMEPV